MLVRDYELTNNIDVLFERKIIVYGAGEYGRRCALLLEDAGVGFECFCDRDTSRQICLDHPIIGPNQLQEKVKNADKEEYMIVVCNVKYHEEMLKELETRQISAYICTGCGIQIGIEVHVRDKRFPEEFQKDFIKRREMYAAFKHKQLTANQQMFLCRSSHPILVYQPGKVGSMSVYETLIPQMDTIHVHNLALPIGIKEGDDIAFYFFDKGKTGGVKIITLVREPIARALSMFMQGFTTEFIVRCHVLKGNFEPFNIEQNADRYDLAADAVEWMTKEILDTNEEFLWFDKELKATTGIDIYQYPFDKERGYAWIKEGKIEILVLKLEKLSDNVTVIGDFVGIPGLKLKNDNVGSEKQSKYIYEELKKRVKIPARLLDSQYKDNCQLDHFYTEEEKEKFRKKWSKYVVEGGI